MRNLEKIDIEARKLTTIEREGEKKSNVTGKYLFSNIVIHSLRC